MAASRRTLLSAFGQRFIQLSREWRQGADAALAPLGVTYATAQPLLAIHRLDTAPCQNALATALGIAGPSLVKLIDQLATEGLVKRSQDRQDRRTNTVELTPKGAALVSRVEAALAAMRERLTSDVSLADLKTTLRVLDAIAEQIAASGDGK